MSEQSIADFAERLHVCLTAEDSDGALIALSAEPEVLARVPRIPRAKWYEDDEPQPIVGLAIALMASALLRGRDAREARLFLEATAELLTPSRRRYLPETSFGKLADRFPYLWAPWTVAAIAASDWAGAVEAVIAFAEATRHSRDGGLQANPQVDRLFSLTGLAAYGPFHFDRLWVLDRQEEIVQRGSYDRNLEEGRKFEALFVKNALQVGQPMRALPLIENLGESYIAATDTASGEFEFNAICAFAALGRFDEALSLAHATVRQGDYRSRRYFTADDKYEWLSAIAQTPAYREFLNKVTYAALPEDDPAANPLCAIRDHVLLGKKKKRCWLTEKLIAPGDPVVEMRRLFDHASDGDYDVVDKAAFENSRWARARAEFESDAITLAGLFPEPRRLRRSWKAPAIAAFHYDVAYDPTSFDLERAVRIVAAHAPRKIRLTWHRGPREYGPAFKPWVGDEGHGDAVDFTWRLLKAGYGAAIFRYASKLPQSQADKVFAMLAVFDRADCRSAAADHFQMPDLPAMMALAFSERPSLKVHLALADFGHVNPRWRAGLVSAMQAYALHLYSNYHPGVDWFLQDLEHFSRGRGCQLLYFLIHHPEDDEVLATMIEKEWLPDTVSRGGYDAYGNARRFYYRAALFNRMLHAPGRLDFWLRDDWVTSYCKSAKDRETRRFAEQWSKTNGHRAV